MEEITLKHVIAAMVNFAIIYLVGKHFLYKPVTELIEGRENEVSNMYSEAEENKKQAETLKSKMEEDLSTAKEKSKKIVENYKQDAEKLYSEIVVDAKREADIIMERARKEAEREKEKARSEIKEEVVDLSILLSEKALEKSIDEKQHRELIKDFITKVGI